MSAQPEQVTTESALLARVRLRDRTAITRLYDEYAPVAYGVAVRVLQDPAAAEDVVQDVFLQLWHEPEAFDATRGSLAGWLAVIARHKAIDVVRKRRPGSDVEVASLPARDDLEQRTQRALIAQQVRNLLSAIPAEQRQALEMAFFEGLTHTQIAARTGDPLGTVKSRIRLALQALKKGLTKQ